MVRFSKEAYARYVQFGTHEALWRANFRDLNSSVTRMATLADGGRISSTDVTAEIDLLKQRWRGAESNDTASVPLTDWLDDAQLAEIDSFERVQLAHVIEVCCTHSSLAAAGRVLFQASRARKRSANDSHRIKQYLAKFGLIFDSLHQNASRHRALPDAADG
ncbi:MAG: transcriptional regulatory protein RtcR [Gammaproteobacteria bacterium]|jgi:transcriptional regulatory protein RtcR